MIAKDVAKIQAMMGSFDEARKTAIAIPDPILKSIALADVARAQAASGNAQAALDWSQKLDNPNIMMAVVEGIADSAERK